jgi:exodeoxyribonuclease I
MQQTKPPGANAGANFQPSFYWYDLETSGTDPKWDRIIQFAGIRTDAELNELDDQACEYIKLPPDVLPQPKACLVTGLSPQQVNAQGLDEIEAFARIERRFAVPGTCVAGFNSLRFDDEFIRYGFYRQLIDPYAREWQGGNSRWDIIDLVRATAALRPDGIEWPRDLGLPVFKLEALTAANRIEHGQAHDALSDVRATIGLARLIRERQPRLFDWYLGLRDKGRVLSLVRPAQPEIFVHVSGRLPRERHCIAPMMPLALHPQNRNSVIAVDLLSNLEPLLALTAEQLAERIFAPQSDAPLRIKEIRVNRVPFVAPLTVMRAEDRERLSWDLHRIEARFEQLRRADGLRAKVLEVFRQRQPPAEADPDAALYQGFIGDADRARCNEVLARLRAGEAVNDPGFDDARLGALLLRLRARHDPGALSAAEQQAWQQFVRNKLLPAPGAERQTPWLTLPAYRQALHEAGAAVQSEVHLQLLRQLEAYGETIERGLMRQPGDAMR